MTDDRRQPGVLDRVLSILETLAAADAERDDSRLDVDYGVDVGTLTDRTPDERPVRTPTDPPDPPSESDDDGAHATVRETEAGYLVVVDLPSAVAESDVTAEVDDGTLVLSVAGRPVERVPVALDGLRVTDMSVRNRVVEATVEREDGG